MAKKNDKRKINNKKLILKNKKQYIFNNVALDTDMSLIDFCNKIKKLADINEKLEHSPDYYFANTIIAWEEKKFDLHRTSLLSLLVHLDKPIPFYINSLTKGQSKFIFSKRTEFLNMVLSSDEFMHPYYALIDIFMRTGAKGRHRPYFNCFMKLLDNIELNKFSNNSILYFFEYFHRLLINDDYDLKILTLKIENIVKSEKSQSLCFFLSYFCLDKDMEKSLKYANEFFELQKLSSNSYLKSLSHNILNLIIKNHLWEVYDFWINIFSSLVENEDEDLLNFQSIVKKEKIKEYNRIQHPLNPNNIDRISIESISTFDLLIVLSLIVQCGSDWGLKINNGNIRYAFPSYEISYSLVKELLDKKILKLSPNDFQKLTDDELYDANQIINNCKIHLNINYIDDSKNISSKLIYEEICRRKDINDSVLSIWKLITLGYFYNMMEFKLGTVNDHWAREFKLNSSTISRIKNTQNSAKKLSYVAYTAIKNTAGAHSLNETTGTRHTQNLLIHNINKQLDFLENSSVDFSKTRYEKAPILSIENIIEQLCNLTPTAIYDEIPTLNLINRNGF